MMPHDRQDLLHDMGHVWSGFSADQIEALFESAGFDGVRYHPIPPDEAAKGPTLFAATARKPLASDATAARPLALTA
jgi:hypothetical protein